MIDKIYLKKKNGLFWYSFTCPYCRSEHKTLYLSLRLRFLVFGESKWHFSCPNCHKTTTKLIMFNVVNDHTDKEERILNSKCWDKRMCKR